MPPPTTSTGSLPSKDETAYNYKIPVSFGKKIGASVALLFGIGQILMALNLSQSPSASDAAGVYIAVIVLSGIICFFVSYKILKD